MKCTLSNSGFVHGSDGKDYLLYEIIKKFRDFYNYSAIIKYNEQEGILSIDMIDSPDFFEIMFNEEQKRAFEGKATDSNIRQLQELLLDNEKGELVRQFRGEVSVSADQLNTRTINTYANDAYARNLNKELLKAGALVVKNGVKATWPYLFIVLSVPIWASLGFFDYANLDKTMRMLFTLSLLGTDGMGAMALIYRLLNHCWYNISPAAYEDTIDSFERFKRILRKKGVIKDYNNENVQEEKEESFSEFLEKESNKDNAKARKYEDQFLNEANIVVNNLNKLPNEMQSQYRIQLSDLLTEYQKRVNKLLERKEGKVVLGEASEVWQIFIELLPELNKINYAITEDLQSLNEQKHFNAEVQEFQQVLAGGYTDEYIDEYIDGYTDDLENGGVLYAEPKKGLN